MSDVAKHLRPAAGDNVAIVTARIEAGEVLGLDSGEVTAPVPVLPGHRICVEPVRAGEDLLSWGLPFGTATTDIAPGDYVCNARVRDVLLMRHPEAYDDTLTVNFVDRDTVADRILPTSPVHAPTPVDIDDAPGFPGFRRGPDRGWGTRNYLAVVGVTSRSRRVVLEAARRLAALHPAADDFDGIVPVVHTEGGGAQDPRNRDLLVRTLAGFVVNANLGAAVVVNDAEARVTNAEVHAALVATGVGPQEYAVRYHVTGEHDEDAEVEQLVALAEQLLPRVMRARREPAPISALRIALQCGGSDAFSGVSANQVVGSTGHELVRRGGVVNLAETDELIGAEQYLLDRVADAGVADGFLHRQQRFKDYAAAHGQTAEGNVSGGNLYRGLYNITLKSLGAARKKDPATSLDRAIDYAERMVDPGYHFMDSPGNDLESIAGQVASGANLVLFTTGNGSITNFPFVPTLKVVTTTERYDLLASDMDVDAGQVLSGRPVADVGRELYELARETAGGRRTKGEGTGQFQTQVWRDWYADLRSGDVTPDPGPARRSGDPAIATTAAPRELAVAAGRVSLVLPTSLCSGQVAEQIVARAAGDRADRVVALPHTEGCGVSGGNAEDIFRDTLVGYATHPSVEGCVFLEHGCEKTHNDYFRTALVGEGIDPGTFRWASIQAEGGIEAVGRSVERALADLSTTPAGPADGDAVVQVGLTTSAEVLAGHGAALLADLVADLLDDGVGVVLASTDPLLQHAALPARLGPLDTEPTLAYSQRPAAPGLHVMDSSSTDWLEIATGLGATGCRVLVTTPAHRPWQPHRFLPTLQLGLHHDEKGLDHQGTEPTSADVLGRLVRRTLSGEHEPRTRPAPDVGFQISRGRFGVSL